MRCGERGEEEDGPRTFGAMSKAASKTAFPARERRRAAGETSTRDRRPPRGSTRHRRAAPRPVCRLDQGVDGLTWRNERRAPRESAQSPIYGPERTDGPSSADGSGVPRMSSMALIGRCTAHSVHSAMLIHSRRQPCQCGQTTRARRHWTKVKLFTDFL
jgi:hypothetical protein